MTQVHLTTALVFMQTCLGGGGGDTYSHEPATESGISCADYQRMLDVELDIAVVCEVDADCTQVLDGTGCGCESDDVIVRGDYTYADWVYSMKEEAESYGCSIDIGNDCACEEGQEPVCYFGQCAWQ